MAVLTLKIYHINNINLLEMINFQHFVFNEMGNYNFI